MNQITHGGIQLVLTLLDCAASKDKLSAEVIAILDVLLVLLVCTMVAYSNSVWHFRSCTCSRGCRLELRNE